MDYAKNTNQTHSNEKYFFSSDDFFHLRIRTELPNFKELVYLFMKRATDLLGASVGLILTLPLFLIIALVIKIEDGGTILFAQKRVGLNGQTFKMLKFRSMAMDAEQRLAEIAHLNEVEGVTFKLKNDPRLTNVGRWLRGHSLDEIPQFINVLKGEMSLVGPRPALISEVESYSDYDKIRLCAIPGLSGLWQVSGRSTTSYAEMIRLDIRYINSRSWWKDCFIMLLTIIQIFQSSDQNGAY